MQALANASLQFSRFSSRLAPKSAVGPRVYARRLPPGSEPSRTTRPAPRGSLEPTFTDPSILPLLAQTNPDNAVLTPFRPDSTEPPTPLPTPPGAEPAHAQEPEPELVSDVPPHEMELQNSKWHRISVPNLDKPLPGWNQPHLTKIRKLQRGAPGFKVLLRKPIQKAKPGKLVGKSQSVISYVQKISWCLNVGAKELGLHVPPDGYVRVRDLTDRREPPHFPRLRTPEKFVQFVDEHCTEYFRTKTFLEWDDGQWKRNLFIRSLTHKPDFVPNTNLKRITLVDRLPVVVYMTGMRSWEYIRRNGIPQSGNRLILLSQRSGSDVRDIFPRTNQVLAVSLDAEKAIKAGVLFFHTDENQLCAAAPPQTGHIPLDVFKGVAQLIIKKTQLHTVANKDDKT